MYLSVLPTALREVQSTSLDKQGDVTPKQHRITDGNGEDMRALGHTGSGRSAIRGDSLELAPKEQQKRELLKQEYATSWTLNASH